MLACRLSGAVAAWPSSTRPAVILLPDQSHQVFLLQTPICCGAWTFYANVLISSCRPSTSPVHRHASAVHHHHSATHNNKHRMAAITRLFPASSPTLFVAAPDLRFPRHRWTTTSAAKPGRCSSSPLRITSSVLAAPRLGHPGSAPACTRITRLGGPN